MTEPTTITLSPSQQRDARALDTEKRKFADQIVALSNAKQEMETRIAVLIRTAIGSAGLDPDVLLAASFALTLEDDCARITCTPPPDIQPAAPLSIAAVAPSNPLVDYEAEAMAEVERIAPSDPNDNIAEIAKPRARRKTRSGT